MLSPRDFDELATLAQFRAKIAWRPFRAKTHPSDALVVVRTSNQASHPKVCLRGCARSAARVLASFAKRSSLLRWDSMCHEKQPAFSRTNTYRLK